MQGSFTISLCLTRYQDSQSGLPGVASQVRPPREEANQGFPLLEPPPHPTALISQPCPTAPAMEMQPLDFWIQRLALKLQDLVTELFPSSCGCVRS